MNTKFIRVLFDKSLSPERLEHIQIKLSYYGLDLEISSDPELVLLVQEAVLSLSNPGLDERAQVQINFASGAANHRRLYGGGRLQALSKAVGLDQKRGLRIVDATAGLAGDSFVMACLGANVLMLERSPVLALMIEEALSSSSERASIDDRELAAILEQMKLIHTDSTDWLSKQDSDSHEVVYLDPMFPERKKKAAVKKEMQLLQTLLEPAMMNDELRKTEERRLLEQARRVSKFRAVVKRPRHAPPLAGEPPGYSLEGKSTRFDIYPQRSIS